MRERMVWQGLQQHGACRRPAAVNVRSVTKARVAGWRGGEAWLEQYVASLMDVLCLSHAVPIGKQTQTVALPKPASELQSVRTRSRR